jgi:hypothetical protein
MAETWWQAPHPFIGSEAGTDGGRRCLKSQTDNNRLFMKLLKQ